MDLSTASSLHPGGCNFAFGDGSVHFIKNTINSWSLDLSSSHANGVTFIGNEATFTSGVPHGLYQALSTRNGGEVISTDSY